MHILESWTSVANDTNDDVCTSAILLQVYLVPLNREAFEEPTVACIFRDVTDRMQSLSQAVRETIPIPSRARVLPSHVHEFYEGIEDAGFVTDADWYVSYINPSVERLIRTVPAEAKGRRLWELCAFHCD